ncbi:DUF1573 domain-containing protein [Pedobacter endophyticus]|uniref:DUF1573 domain-containing protein n=1 Tax=Pedobacter endophyticus TaxID=2789740 RepID=A0A7S9KZ19_9SPHI|nr:DUF1573 domain-containing protein [Pedobacter endophyticus]QPH39479.1 DUF1573 domain-containing protein [Pedobacter endophyticus]
MKKVFLMAIAVLTFASCRNANNSNETSTLVSVGNDTTAQAQIAPGDAPVIVFERDVYDFGKIAQGEKVLHEFKFRNTGKSPLIISNATATCGCTVPQIPGEPILPGKEGKINVVFNSEGKMGVQDKVVTVTSNANPNIATVHLVGEVLEKK